MTLYELMEKGGPVMWPLLACSVTALAVVLERGWFWFRLRHRQDEALLDRLFRLAREGRFAEALEAASASDCPLVKVLAAGLAQRQHGLSEALEATATDLIEETRRRLAILDTLITLAPLLGILGTVTGIIFSFDLLGSAGIEDPRAVTGGIAQALITTAAGLTVAIVALLPYNALVRRGEKLAHRLEQLVMRFEIAVREGEAARPGSGGE